MEQKDAHEFVSKVKVRMKDVQDALSKALKALISAQSANDLWEEYHLPVGTSNEWISAYIALSIWEATPLIEEPICHVVSTNAFQALLRNRTRPVGFGYNEFVAADTDSTASVLLLAHAVGAAPMKADIGFLQAHQRADGGFATFQGPCGWGKSHNCVTPVCALALYRNGIEVSDKVIDYALNQRNPDGTWDSYWWDGTLYATAAWLRFLAEFQVTLPKRNQSPASLKIKSAFDLALACEIASRCHLADKELLYAKLIETQNEQGLWPRSKNLRVTDEACQTHKNLTGTLYVDGQSLMTTATAVRALSFYLSNAR